MPQKNSKRLRQSLLPVEVRSPTTSERAFFAKTPQVSGMAAEDDRVVLNPFSSLSDLEKRAVVENETTRILLRRGAITAPTFALTSAQRLAFALYGPPSAQRETILGRLVSGDPSAGIPTGEQERAALAAKKTLRQVLAPRNPSAPSIQTTR